MTKRLKRGKIVRREGINLFDADKYSRILARRSYPPGVHGPKGIRRRKSAYGEQLRAKQQLKLMYGLRERQFSNLVTRAMGSRQNTTQEIIRLLERRLDNVVFRLGLARTRSQARQLVSHRHIKVNGRNVTIPSYMVSKGDIVSIHPSAQKNKYFTTKFAPEQQDSKAETREFPLWLNWDQAKLEGKVTGEPDVESVSSLINVSKVVEFYSR